MLFRSISASHVFRDSIPGSENFIANRKFIFEFDKVYYPIDDMIHDEYDKKTEIYKDLRIYKTEDFNSPYHLFDGEYPWERQLRIYGWHFVKDKVQNFTNDVILKENVYYHANNKKTALKNCFGLWNSKVYEGNSGCPVLDENIVYGMLFGQDIYDIGKAIRSDYILKTLSFCSK